MSPLPPLAPLFFGIFWAAVAWALQYKAGIDDRLKKKFKKTPRIAFGLSFVVFIVSTVPVLLLTGACDWAAGYPRTSWKCSC